ncbi:MAG: serine/threonine protein kinase [Deltaproteobacteria bacterium]|nr:serine/threonine protein kinase [Deltaproteobacteria bacterium]
MLEAGKTVRSSEPAVTATHGGQFQDRTGATLLGRYRLERLIANGGMGVVYAATQLGLGRQVAVKLLEPRFRQSDPDFAKRFFLEAATAARLIHPNIVTVHDYGESENGELFIAMELLTGRSTAEVVDHEGPLGFDRILGIALQIGRALREAHAAGVVHRDLKPTNVVISKGPDEDQPDLVKVLDFGLVKLVEGRKLLAGPAADVSESGLLLGSPKYMAPEQVCCEEVDARADVYSFGVLLYYLATGVVPFSGTKNSEILQAQLTAPVPPMWSVGYRRSIPPSLELIIARCLEKSPDKRYPSMNQLVGELKATFVRLVGSRGRAVSGVMSAVGDMVGEDSDRSARTDLEVPLAPGALPVLGAPEHEGSITVRTEAPRFVLPPGLAPPGALPGHWTSAPPRAEAQFAPPGLVRSMPLGARRDPRLPWLIAGVSMVALGAVLVVTMNLGRQETAPVVASIAQPAETAIADDEVRVTFDSVPRGAKVEEQGVALGITPFIVTFPRTEPDFYRVFIFRRDGHHPTTVQTTLATSKVSVKAVLEVRSDGQTDDALEVARLREMAKKVTGDRVAPLPRSIQRARAESQRAAAPAAAPVAAPAAVVAEASPPLMEGPEREIALAPADEKSSVIEATAKGAVQANEGSRPATQAAPAARDGSKSPPAPGAPAEERAPKASAVAPETAAPAAVPARAPEPPAVEPRKVPTAVLQRTVTQRVEPRLPPNIILKRAGEKLKIVVLVCTNGQGSVDRSRTKIMKGEPGADEAVLDAVGRWRFAAGEPLCAPMFFSFDVKR